MVECFVIIVCDLSWELLVLLQCTMVDQVEILVVELHVEIFRELVRLIIILILFIIFVAITGTIRNDSYLKFFQSILCPSSLFIICKLTTHIIYLIPWSGWYLHFLIQQTLLFRSFHKIGVLWLKHSTRCVRYTCISAYSLDRWNCLELGAWG